MSPASPDSPPLPPRPRVGVVGATGLVGEVLLDVLATRQFPLGELVPFAGAKSEGKRIRFAGREITVRRAEPAAFEGLDLVFFAATGALSKELAPAAIERGARVIDKSSTWRLNADVPLVVPEVNGVSLEAGASLVASPNCTTTALVMALEPIRRAAGLRHVVVTTMQAASGAGRSGLEELEAQERDLLEHGAAESGAVFGAVLARNVLPVCDRIEGDGSSAEEHKLLLETRKIMGLPDLALSATCTRVPVPIGHSASIWIETESPLTPEQASAALAAFPGVRVVDEPTAAQVAGKDAVLVGRVRRSLDGRGLLLWQASDNLRKGAATNAVQIAERWLPGGGPICDPS